MQKLSNDWFLEGTLDFEYKKYLLLAYLQHVSREFAEVRLYPSFAELIAHYNNLNLFQSKKQELYQRFPTRISQDEFRKLKLVKKTEVEEEGEIVEIDSIIHYAMPTIKSHLEAGKEIYDFIDDQINIEPVGITPLYRKEGYLFLHANPRRQVSIFQYRVIFLENTDANYHGISLQPVDTFERTLAHTYEAKKQELIRTHTGMPNPATWLVYAVQPFPEEATLLPVAKRKMLAFLKNRGLAD
jgi:hypothetical protein